MTSTAPDDAVTGTPDGPEEGLRWHVEDWAPDKPFTGRLVWSDAEGPIVWADLDPILVRDLSARLLDILSAQRAALGLTPSIEQSPTDTPQPNVTAQVTDSTAAPSDTPASISAAPDPSEDSDAVEDDVRSWFRRHLIITILLGVPLAIALITAIAGGIYI